MYRVYQRGIIPSKINSANDAAEKTGFEEKTLNGGGHTGAQKLFVQLGCVRGARVPGGHGLDTDRTRGGGASVGDEQTAEVRPWGGADGHRSASLCNAHARSGADDRCGRIGLQESVHDIAIRSGRHSTYH